MKNLDNNWQKEIYYKTSRPCCVCSKEGNNGIEPRFGYVVCEFHSNIAPAYIKDYAEEYKATHGTV